MPKKGLYLEVAGDVDKKLLKDLESLENRLKSLLQGISGKFDNKQFKRVGGQLQALIDLFGEVRDDFKLASSNIKSSLGNVQHSIESLAKESDPALQSLSSTLSNVQEAIQAFGQRLENTNPQFEKFVSLINELEEGGRTAPITKKFKELEESFAEAKQQAIDLKENTEGIFEYKDKLPAVEGPKFEVDKDLGKKTSENIEKLLNSDAVIEFQGKIHGLMGTMMELNTELKEGVDGEEAAKAYGKALKKLLEQYEKYKGQFERSEQFKQVPGLRSALDYIKEQYDEAIGKVDQLKDHVGDLGASVEETLKKVGSVGTEAGSLLDEKMLLQDLSVAPEDTYYDYLEAPHKALKALIKALKEKRDAQGEIQDAYEEIRDAASDAAAAGPVSEQLLELLGRWKEKLVNVDDLVRKIGQGLEGQAEKEEKVAKAAEKTGETEKQSLEAKKKQAEEIGKFLDEEEEKREKLSKKTQEYEEEDAEKAEETEKRKVIVRKKAAKTTEDAEKRKGKARKKAAKTTEDTEKRKGKARKKAAKTTEDAEKREVIVRKKAAKTTEDTEKKKKKSRKKTAEAAKDSAKEIAEAEKEATDAAKESADKIEDIAGKQKEKIAEPKIADVDFSEAEEKFNAFTDKVQQGVTDLSNSIKRIFDELGGLIQEGVRTIEIAVTPKGFDETIGKQRELDEALLGSAKTAEDVSDREQQAFLESASAFISASDAIKEHQKEVDEALKKSGDIAEGVSEQEKKAFSGIGGTPGKIETPEAESGTLDLMAQLLIQVTKNLDLMSQRMEATREEMKNFNKEMDDTTSSLDDMASGPKKSKKEGIIDSDEIKHLKLFEQIVASLQNTLGGSQEEISGYTRRAKEMSEQVVKLGITLKELGMLETEEEFQEWINSISTSELVLADNLNALQRTKKGFRAFTEDGKKALKLDEDMVSILKLLDSSLSSYAKRLYDLQTKSETGNIESRELLESLEKVASVVGTSEQSFKRYNEILINIQQHFKDLKGQSDESVGAMIDDIDQAAVALEAYRGNVKVTKSSMEALNDEGFEPFSDLGEDLAKELKITGKAFQKFRKDSEQISHLEAYNYVFKELTENMDASRESYKGAEERAKKVADQIVKLGITLKELGVLESKKDFEKWLEGIDVTNIALAEHSEFLKETKKGYRAAQPAGEEFLNLNEDMKNALAASEKSVTLYEERLYELEKSYTAGNKEALEQISTLKELGAKIGTNDEAFKKYDKILTQVTQHFRDLERRSDGTTKQIIKGVDKASVAFEAYEGNIKVTKDALEVLNGDGYEPFLELNEDAARDLDIIGNKFDKARESTSEYKEAMRKAAEENDSHAQALKKLSEQYGDSEFHTAAYNKIIRKAKKYISEVAAVLSYEINKLEEQKRKNLEAGKSVTQLNEKLEKKKQQLKEVTDKTALATIALDEFEDELGGSSKGFRKFDKYIKGSVHQLGFLGDAFSMVGKRVKQFAAFAVAAAAVQQIFQGIQQFIEVVSEYDQALHNLMAILEVTNARVQILGDSILRVAEQTKFSALEVAKGVQTLGQAGLSLNESIMAVKGVTQLATGTLSDFADVSDLVTTSLNAFQLAATESTRIADVFANAINNSKLNIDKLRTAFNYVGAAGKQAGLDLNELTGTLMVLADNGIRASTMGTGLRRMMLQMIDPSNDLRVEMAKFGVEVESLNPKFVGWQKSLENLTPLLWDFEERTVDMEKAVKFFGTRAAQVAAIVIRTTADQSNAIVEATDKTREFGSAAEMMARQQEGLALKMKNLEDRIKNVAIALGEAGLTGLVKDVVDAMRDAAKATADFIKEHERIAEISGILTTVTILTTAFAGLGLVFSKMTKKIGVLLARHGVLLKTIGGITAVVTGLVSVFDRLISRHFEASQAAAKHSEQINLNSQMYESWIDTIDQAFGTERWSNTIKRFKEQTAQMKESGAAAEDFAKKLEEDLGVQLEKITDPDIIEDIKEFEKVFRKEELGKSIESAKVGFSELREQIANMNSLGHEFGDGMDENLSILQKIGKYINEGLLISPLAVKLAEVFGASTEEVRAQWDELSGIITQRMNAVRKLTEMSFDDFSTYFMKTLKDLQKGEDAITKEMAESIKKNLSENVFLGFRASIELVRAEMIAGESDVDNFGDKLNTLRDSTAGALDGSVDLRKALEDMKGSLSPEHYKQLSDALRRDLSPAMSEAQIRLEQLERQYEALGLQGANLNEQFQLGEAILSVSEFQKKYTEFLEEAFKKAGRTAKEAEVLATKIAEKEAKKRIAIRRYELESMSVGLSREEQLEKELDIVETNGEKEKTIIDEKVAHQIMSEEEAQKRILEIDRKVLETKKALISAEKDYVEENVGTLNDVYRDLADQEKKLQQEISENAVNSVEARYTRIRSIVDDTISSFDEQRDKRLNAVASGSIEELKIQLETEEKKRKFINDTLDHLEGSVGEEGDLWKWLVSMKTDLTKSGSDKRLTILEKEMKIRRDSINRELELLEARYDMDFAGSEVRSFEQYKREKEIAKKTYDENYDYYTEHLNKLNKEDKDYEEKKDDLLHKRKLAYFDYMTEMKELDSDFYQSREELLDRDLSNIERQSQKNISEVRRRIALSITEEEQGAIEIDKIQDRELQEKRKRVQEEIDFVVDEYGTQNDRYRELVEERKDLDQEATDSSISNIERRNKVIDTGIQDMLEKYDRYEKQKLLTVKQGTLEEMKVKANATEKRLQAVKSEMDRLDSVISHESDQWKKLEDLKIQYTLNSSRQRFEIIKMELANEKSLLDQKQSLEESSLELREAKLGEYQNKTLDMYRDEVEFARKSYAEDYNYYTDYLNKLKSEDREGTQEYLTALNERGQLTQDHLIELAEMYKEMNDQRLQEEGTFTENMKKGMKDAASGWQTSADFIQNVFATTFDEMHGGLSTFLSDIVLQTESVSDAWKNMTNDMLSSITDLMSDYLMQQFLSSMFGMSKTNTGVNISEGGGWVGKAGSWIASLFSSTAHSGGIVGKDVGVSIDRLNKNLSSLPRYHNGNEYAAVLKKNEGVFTPEQMKALVQGGGNGRESPQITNNVYIQAPEGKLSKESFHQLQTRLGKSMSRSMRRG